MQAAPVPAAPFQATGALIGPNAILQTVAVLDRMAGRGARDRVMARAAVPMPDGSAMIPEDQAAAMHRAVRAELAGQGDAILRAAGLATADYILRHRIPPVAQRIIRALPAPLGARLLASAIARHAWTFAGSGGFRVRHGRPLLFEVTDNPLRDPDGHPCLWHAAVFERLFRALVWPRATVREVDCIAQGGALCRFEIWPQGWKMLARDELSA
jgi:divinyl protochlorophyllide a 8-vinyl-reductase